MTVIAYIPVRGGSKGVTKKNIYPLGGYPLIAYTIAAAKLSKHIERIIVSTDSEEIAEIAIRYGAEVPFIRPSEFAQDHSPDRGHSLHAMNWFKENEGSVPEYWVHLRATTPFRNPEVMDEAIQEIQNHSISTSLRSGHLAPESPCKWFKRDENGFFIGNCPDDKRPEYYMLPRQLFPPVYNPNGYVDIMKSSFVLNSESLLGDKMIGFITPMTYEVDTLDEMEMLEYQLEKKGSPLVDYFKKRGIN
jgi:CMP-N,N'-diacetyllegionaminic acid synthase